MENSQLLELIGKTKTQNLLDDITKEYAENKIKTLGETKNPINSNAIVTILKNEDEIKHIGMSCINDLLLDNFGIWFGELISGDTSAKVLKNTAGANRNLRVYGNANLYNTTGAGAVGFKTKTGKGLTPASRTDVDLSSPFTVAPENGFPVAQQGAWNSGLAKVSTSSVTSPTGGSGSVSEFGFYSQWEDAVNVLQTFMLSHENISPVVPFVAGEAINVDYSWILS